MSFYGAETWYIKLNKKYLKNISAPYHKAIKRNCGRNSYHSNQEFLEQVFLLIFKHFLAKKQYRFTFRLFHSRRPCLCIYKYYLRYGSLFCKYIRKLFSAIRLLMLLIIQCVISLRIDYVQRNEPRSSGYDQVDCFIIVVWSSIVLLSKFAVFTLINFFLTMYNEVWITFLVGDVLFCYILMTWNIYVLCYEIKYCLFDVCLFILS